MARRLPPFAAIRAFEAAARHGNLRIAGEELRLTVSALSHQIKSLEDYLGTPLFLRRKNALNLTPTGKGYLLELTRALDIIAASTEQVEQERHQKSVTINMFPSLAALWLLPRLSAFRKLEPDIDVRVITTFDPIDFRSGQIDLAIRYGVIPPETAHTMGMFNEVAFPVCSPAYAVGISSIDNCADLSSLTLIRTQTSPHEWKDWFSFVGFKGTPPLHKIDVDSRALALDAAAAGLGITMGRTPFVNGALTSGRLRRISDRTLMDGQSYYLTKAVSAQRSQVASKFSQWLLDQASEMRLPPHRP